MNFKDLKNYFEENKTPAFRLKQIMQSYYVESKGSWNEVTTLSKKLREDLSQKINWFSFEVEKIEKDDNEFTTKVLLRLLDGNTIESVLMKHATHYTVCLSSQVGCQMGCGFCATGQSGYVRNLTSEEIVDQIVFWNNYLSKEDKRVGNIVFMGMGEPFMNWENIKKALNKITSDDGLNIGSRHISISTCGIVDKIEEFAKFKGQINLAISLHSAIDKTRSKIMPINNKYPLDKLIKACLKYADQTKRKLFFEYTLLGGVNDSREEVEALVKFVKQHYLFHLNLIPYNPTSDKFKNTSKEKIDHIVKYLNKNKVRYTLRKSFGTNIDAACGQLRRKSL